MTSLQGHWCLQAGLSVPRCRVTPQGQLTLLGGELRRGACPLTASTSSVAFGHHRETQEKSSSGSRRLATERRHQRPIPLL